MRTAIFICIVMALMAFQPVKNLRPGEGFIQVTGGKVWYRIVGEGDKTPLLMLHGGPGCPSYYLNPLAELGKDRPVIFYDQLGCGRSDNLTDTSLMTVDHYVEQLEQLRKSLGLKEFYLYGASWGTMLGMDYYLKYPESIKAIIFSGPCLSTKMWSKDAEILISTLPDTAQNILKKSLKEGTFNTPEYLAVMDMYYKKFVFRTSSADLDSCTKRMNFKVYEHMWGPNEFTATGTLKEYDRTGTLGKIKVPTLFTSGEFDEARPSTVQYYQSLVPGAKYVLMKNAGHMSMQDNPQQDIQAIREFLESLENWTIPAGGNSYRISQLDENREIRDAWQSPDEKRLYFFYSDRPCLVDLSVNLSVPEGESRIEVQVAGKKFALKVSGAEPHKVKIGRVKLDRGYSRVEFRGVTKEGDTYGELSDLEVHSLTPGLTLAYVKDNQDNRFYWGRRGPSVHLNYELPKGVDIEYFYNELTVPAGMDPVGSYFMADGFGEGYFGMQVNSLQERRVLFSVWSPFKTDRPGDIPETDKIAMLSKGEGVHTGEFGNEGSGGQSYFRYPWKAGTTYRFLLKGKPDGNGKTVFTAWFYAPESAKWQLIASFSRPKTDHYLTRLHSFLENFNDRNGYLTRKGLYTNQWCRDKNGQWYPITKARFSGDDIAKRGYRLDYAGGTEGSGFYLRNGGFFNVSTVLNSIFELTTHPAKAPDVDFGVLE